MDGNNDDSANITGKEIILIANTGDIGSVDNFLDIATGKVVDAFAHKGSIYLAGVGGNIPIGMIRAENGDVHLRADRSIIGRGKNKASIVAINIHLKALGGLIGTKYNHLKINALHDGTLTASSMGDIYIREMDGDMHLNTVESKRLGIPHIR